MQRDAFGLFGTVRTSYTSLALTPQREVQGNSARHGGCSSLAQGRPPTWPPLIAFASASLLWASRPGLDLGLAARLGMLYGPHAGDVGIAASAGADVRFWPRRYFALSAGSSVGFASGSSNDPRHDLGYLFAAIELGVTVAL